MKSRSILAVLLFMLLNTFLFTSCSKDNNSNNGGNGNGGHTPDTTTATNKVSIANLAYTPGSLTVKAGTTITWTNNDDMQHTVTADNGSFASSRLNKGDTYSHAFSAAGTYPYHCELHPFMKATVVAN